MEKEEVTFKRITTPLVRRIYPSIIDLSQQDSPPVEPVETAESRKKKPRLWRELGEPWETSQVE